MPTPTPTSSPLAVIISGDSTVANNGSDQPAIASFLPDLNIVASIAQPGDTIAGQRAKFDALSPTPLAAAQAVIIQVGLNDMGDPYNQLNLYAASVTITALQAYVDDVRSKVSERCRIYVSTMTPANGRWAYFTNDPATIKGVQDKWAAINEAVSGKGSYAIADVDGRITAHSTVMASPPGFLASAYDTGDHIHPNTAGRRINATDWHNVLVTDGLLTN